MLKEQDTTTRPSLEQLKALIKEKTAKRPKVEAHLERETLAPRISIILEQPKPHRVEAYKAGTTKRGVFEAVAVAFLLPTGGWRFGGDVGCQPYGTPELAIRAALSNRYAHVEIQGANGSN